MSTRTFIIEVCDQCLNLEGKQCNNEECKFVRWTMDDVEIALKQVGILPLNSGMAVEMKIHGLRQAIVDELMESSGELTDGYEFYLLIDRKPMEYDDKKVRDALGIIADRMINRIIPKPE